MCLFGLDLDLSRVLCRLVLSCLVVSCVVLCRARPIHEPDEFQEDVEGESNAEVVAENVVIEDQIVCM